MSSRFRRSSVAGAWPRNRRLLAAAYVVVVSTVGCARSTTSSSAEAGAAAGPTLEGRWASTDGRFLLQQPTPGREQRLSDGRVEFRDVDAARGGSDGRYTISATMTGNAFAASVGQSGRFRVSGDTLMLTSERATQPTPVRLRFILEPENTLVLTDSQGATFRFKRSR